MLSDLNASRVQPPSTPPPPAPAPPGLATVPHSPRSTLFAARGAGPCCTGRYTLAVLAGTRLGCAVLYWPALGKGRAGAVPCASVSRGPRLAMSKTGMRAIHRPRSACNYTRLHDTSAAVRGPSVRAHGRCRAGRHPLFSFVCSEIFTICSEYIFRTYSECTQNVLRTYSGYGSKSRGPTRSPETRQ